MTSAPGWLQIIVGCVILLATAVAVRSGLIKAWIDDFKHVAHSRTGHRELVSRLGQQILALPAEQQPVAIASYLHLKDGRTSEAVDSE